MKVIMLKDIGGVGRRGEVKEVSDGYALNFLIPHGSAEQATPSKIAQAEAVIKAQHAAKEKESAALKASVHSLEGARIAIVSRATEKGGLFKSITAADIAGAVKLQTGVQIPQGAINLEKPIKETGEHAIEIRAAGIAARIIVVISAAN